MRSYFVIATLMGCMHPHGNIDCCGDSNCDLVGTRLYCALLDFLLTLKLVMIHSQWKSFAGND